MSNDQVNLADDAARDMADYGGRYGIVAGRFNQFITDQLLAGAQSALHQHGVHESQIQCVWVPGAFEIPWTCKRLMAARKVDAVIALGAVIRGETPHFEYVAGACAQGIAQLNLRGDIPVIFGVLTTDTVEQAVERADPDRGNKGAAAALAAMEMVSLLRRL